MYNINPSLSKQEEIQAQSIQRIKDLESVTSAKEMSSPLPLLREMPPAAPYPIDALGSLLGGAAQRLHEIIKAPDAICGNSILAVAALTAQAYADVEIDGRRIPLSLFLLTAAESGDRKSAVDNVALRPVQEYQKMLLNAYSEDLHKYKNKKDLWTKDRAKILNSKDENLEEQLDGLEEPSMPLKPIILMEEPTYEGLVNQLAIGEPTVGLFSDEGGRMFGGFGMDPKNLLKTACGLSSLWDGRPISRIRTDEGFTLYGRRFSTHLLIQENVLEQVLNNSTLISQGLLARCLMVFPPTMAGKRDYQSLNPFEDPLIQKYQNKIVEIWDYPVPKIDAKQPNVLNPRSLLLSSRAKASWILFHNEVDKMIIGSGRYFPIRRMANKAAEQVLRIAGSLTLIKDFDAYEIAEEEIARGVELTRYYLEESLRICSSGITDPNLILAQRVLDWMKHESKEKEIEYFPLNFIYQKGPAAVRDSETARRIMHILAKHDAIISHPNQKINGKTRKEVWKLNECSE